MAGRALISKLPSFSSSLRRLRPILAAASPTAGAAATAGRLFSTAAISSTGSSSLNDPAPNSSNRPPKETIPFDGCDFEHWLVITQPPEPYLTRDEIINGYIKILARVLHGSEDPEEEARMKIYSVSTKYYFAFGALVSEELANKIKTLPSVRWVIPDKYLDVENKDYGGEPFIQGEAVPYDPKYHEEYLRDTPRRNENMDALFQNRDAPPMPNQGFQSPPQQGDRPPMNSSSNVQNAPKMPNSEFTPQQGERPPMNSSSNVENAPQMPNSEFNGVQLNFVLPQSNYAPTGPAYQGNSQNYQVELDLHIKGTVRIIK